MILFDLLNFILLFMAVNPNCDYFDYLKIDRRYFIYNPEFPKLYKNGTSCNWEIHSPPKTVILLICPVINLPSSNNCQQDRLEISLTSPILADSRNYCGFGTLALISDSNSMSVGLFTSQFSTGGKFICTLYAIPLPTSCDCGWRLKRKIVGGVETGINEFPFMAALIDVQKEQVHCGAAIISERYALTAARCLAMMETGNLALLVGDHDLTTGLETTSTRIYFLESFIVHPMYNNLPNQNDIGIVQTRNFMQFSLKVGPICLPFRYTDATFDGFSVTVLGWGATVLFGSPSPVLLAANVSILSNLECQQKLPSEQIMSTQACTYAPGKDSCEYDTGGPVIWFDSKTTNRYQLIGLDSYGSACDLELPSVHTRVSSYLPWILENTIRSIYCMK